MTFKPFASSRIRRAWEYRTEPEALQTLAATLWRTLLVVAAIVLLLALWFGSQELDAASQAESVAPSSGAVKQPWTPAQLQAALDAFSQKQSDYQTLSRSPLPAVADPSK